MSENFERLDLVSIDWTNTLSNIPGFPVECLKAVKFHTTCPICNGHNAFRFSNYHGEGNWICKNCGAGKGPRLIHETLEIPYDEVFKLLGSNGAIQPSSKKNCVLNPISVDLTPKEIEKNRRHLKKALRESKWMKRNDAAWRYLANRVPLVDLSKIDKTLRLHLKMEFWMKEDDKSVMKGLFPTMLQVVTDNEGNFVKFHRTYLTNHGTKVPFGEAKQQMGGLKKLTGDFVNIVSVPTCRTIAVGEGYETMLAVAVAHNYQINTRSYIDAGNLAKATFSREKIDKVIIYADHDKYNERQKCRPGTRAAERLSSRLKELGFEVEIRIPKVEKTDWADVWVDATSRIDNLTNRLVTRCIQLNSDDPFKVIDQLLAESLK